MIFFHGGDHIFPSPCYIDEVESGDGLFNLRTTSQIFPMETLTTLPTPNMAIFTSTPQVGNKTLIRVIEFRFMDKPVHHFRNLAIPTCCAGRMISDCQCDFGR